MQSLIDLITKYRRQLIAPISIIFTCLLLIQFYFVFAVTPIPNDECIWSPGTKKQGDRGIYFTEVKFEGVTWNGGIRDGDRLLEINGKKIENTQTASFVLYNLAAGDTAIYRVNRSGRTFDAKVEIKKLIQIGGLSYVLLSAIWLIVAVIVLRAKPYGYTQIVFYRVGAAFVLYSCFNLLQSINIFNPIFDYPLVAMIVDTVQTFGGIFLPFIIIHFFWIFPRRFNFLDKKLITRSLYIVPLCLFIIITLFKLLFIYDDQAAIEYFFRFYTFLINGLLIFCSIVGLVSLFINYIKLETKNERNAIFIILVAYAIGVSASLYTVVITRLVAASALYNSPELFSPIILIVLLPVAFGYSIFKYSLLDVTDVLKTTILYGSATVSVAAVYFLIIYALGLMVSTAIGTDYQGIIAGIVFIVFAVIFQSTKERFQEIITRKFYPEQFAYQKVLVKFSNDVATIVGLENILQSTCSTFVESLNLEKFAIMLRDKSKNNIYNIVESKGFNASNLRSEVSIGNLAQFILSKKDSNLLIVIEENDFEFIFPDDFKKLEEEGIYTIIPLIIQSKIIGFVLFGLKHSGSKFAGKDLELLSAAANQTAVAIENARLYQAEAEKLKLDRDLENARLIQDSLLPSKFPELLRMDICGKMIPAMQVGGDYYDLIKVSDTQLFAVIGDVSGKGLAASFYMSKLQTMVSLFCDGSMSPKEILTEINHRIFGSIERNWFITVSIAFFDLDKKSITYARAGHTPLLLIERDNIKEYTPAGIGIGLEKGEIFRNVLEEITIPLKSGTLVSLYSDGITELMNDSSELFGSERLNIILQKNMHLRCSEIMKTITDNLDLYKNGASQNDDVTLLLIKNN